jgi:hypothetical protein
MKRCPTCRRAYDDDRQSFCTEDGTPLDLEPGSSSYQGATVVDRPASGSGSGLGSDAGSWQQTALPRKRNVLPWVLGVAAVVVFGFIGLVVVIAVIIGANANKSTSNLNSYSGYSNRSYNSSLNRNSTGSSATNTASANRSYGGGPSTDSSVVLRELTEIENEWTEANFKGDVATVDGILADDYTGTDVDGTVQNKQQYLARLRPNPAVMRWKMSGLKLDLVGSRAVLTGLLTIDFQSSPTASYQFTDTFAWRDGEWLAVNSTVSQVHY